MPTLAAVLLTAVLQAGLELNPTAFSKLSAHLTVLEVTVGRDTFATVQRRLGKAEVRHNEMDAAGSAEAACYVGPDGTALAFVSYREAGGGRQLITDVHLASSESRLDFSPQVPDAAHEATRPRCLRLRELSRKTATGGKLRLGVSGAEARRLLGKPTEESADALVYRARKDESSGLLTVRVQLSTGIVSSILCELDPLG